MLSIGIVAFVVGILMSLCAFIYAALNMKKAFDDQVSVKGIFGGHISSMIGMAIGGFISVGGIVAIIIHFATQVTGGA